MDDMPGRAPAVYETIPPLREEPFTSDEWDDERVRYVTNLWSDQDHLLIDRDRSIEENLRMLAGQQWGAYSELAGRWVDLSELLSDNEVAWRSMPVVNMLTTWFVLTHARLTENSPIVTFQPGSGDQQDAQIAETLDVITKQQWGPGAVGMEEVIDRLIAVMIPCTEVYFKSGIDPQKGPIEEWRGQGVVPLVDYDGMIVEGVEVEADDVAFDADGNPLSVAMEVEDGSFALREPDGMAPHSARKGGLAVDVLFPMEVRGAWGTMPWHEKPWHMQRSLMSPAEVYERWGVEVEADVNASYSGVTDLQSMLLGSGYYGAASNHAGRQYTNTPQSAYTYVYELWQAPGRFPGMEETKQSAGGRMMIVAGGKCIRDGVRPYRVKWTSPIRQIQYVWMPGRQSGTSMQEPLNSLQRALNRMFAASLTHASAVAAPQRFVDQATGLSYAEMSEEPGTTYIVPMPPNGRPPVTYVAPPPMGEDVYRAQNSLLTAIRTIGQLDGAQGVPETRDPSGEMVRELRANSDRPIAATARRCLREFARMIEDWIAILPLVMSDEEVISYAGEDRVMRTMLVLPKLFEDASYNVVPDMESMLPEGKGERAARIDKMYQGGVFGPPGTPQASMLYLEFSRLPHPYRVQMPGGKDRVTAEQENSQLLLGTPADALKIEPWMAHDVHILVLRDYMATDEFLYRTELPIQQQFVLHWQAHVEAQQAQMMEAAMQSQAAQMLTQPNEEPMSADRGE